MKRLLILLAFVEMATFIVARPTTFHCGGKPADIVFIIDTSSSIWRPDFDNHVIPFVKDVVQMFDIGSAKNQSRVGIVTFANEYVHQFHLNDHMDKETLANAIDDISFSGGNTNTFKAIKYMTDDMFRKENGARDNVARVAIILTDGGSDDREATRQEAERARQLGFTVFAIGVGYRVDFTELHDLASDPDYQTLFFVVDFRALDSIKRVLAIRTCEVKVIHTTTKQPPTTTTTQPTSTSTSSTTTTTPATTTSTTQSTTTTTTPSTTTQSTTTTSTTSSTTTTPSTTTEATTTAKMTQKPIPIKVSTTTGSTVTTSTAATASTTTAPEIPPQDQAFEDCTRVPADIYFLLDSSSSVYILDFNNKMLPFVRNIVSSFNIGPDDTRVSLMTFSDQLNPIFSFNDFTSKDALLKAIYPDTVKYTSGGTYTHQAIKYVKEKGFSPKISREGVPKIMIVITDGVSYQPTLTASEAEAAKASGISVFAIGVGPSVDLQELKTIASEPSDNFMFSVSDFDALDNIKGLITQKTCNARVAEKESPPLTECEILPTDLTFLFESASRSVSERRAIHKTITAVAEKIDTVPVLKARIRVGTLTDPCPAENAISFTDLKSFQSKMAAVVSKTNIRVDELVRQFRREKVMKGEEVRERVAVLVVDENTRKVGRLLTEVGRAKYKGIEVYVIAVGAVKDDVLKDLASSPTTGHVMKVDSYDVMEPTELNLLNRMCSGSNNHLPALKPQ